MSAKQTTPDQHNLLHLRWPNDCCLCNKEQRIQELEAHIREQAQELARYKELLQQASWLLSAWQIRSEVATAITAALSPQPEGEASA